MSKPRRYDISTDSGMAALHAYRKERRLLGKRVIVEEVSEKRNSDQNSLSFAIYKQIAAQAEDMTIEDIRRRCKLDIGVPILCRDDDEFRYVYENSTALMSYDKRLISMKWTDVTSKFKKAQFSEYMDAVIREYSQQGYALLHPSEERMAMKALRAAG